MLIYLQMIESEADQNKFEQLYWQYRNLMFHIARGILHNQQDAEDAVHQAFLTIVTHIKKISQVKCPETRSFIVIITERKAIDILRERNRYVPLELDEAMTGVPIPPPDGELAGALARLPARYREVLLLRFDSGFSTREIANMLGMKQEAVQKLIWRAKEALQKALQEDDELL